MGSLEPKKLALLRTLQILKEYTDYDHPLTQEELAAKLCELYGIEVERRAVSRNLSLLREAGIDIGARHGGSYLIDRDFEDSELRMLIDGVLSSKYITAAHSKDLIERLCSLSNRYFKAGVKHIYTVDDWNKTDNQALFLNIDLIDEAIEKKKQIKYCYNKYGPDKKYHTSSQQVVSPYQMILHNQRYYLMAYSEKWKNITFHRLDKITDMKIVNKAATPLKSVPGYENGINYREISSAMPYMYTDRPERVEFLCDRSIIDQVVDWFGKDVTIEDCGSGKKYRVSLLASPGAMEYWAMQYTGHVEILTPQSLRSKIIDSLREGLKKYQ